MASRGTVLVLEAEETTGYHATGGVCGAFYPKLWRTGCQAHKCRKCRILPGGAARFGDAPLLTSRGCLAVALADHAAELDAVLAKSEPGEEVVEITPKDVCTLVSVLRPM